MGHRPTRRLVWWTMLSFLVMLVVCVEGVKGKNPGLGKHQQQQDEDMDADTDSDTQVRSRIRKLTTLISGLMHGFTGRSTRDKADYKQSNMRNKRSEDAVDAPITQDIPHTTKEDSLNDALPRKSSSDVLSEAEEKPWYDEGTKESEDKKYHQSVAGMALNDHLHYEVSADPAQLSCSNDQTDGSCSSVGGVSALPLPVAHELSNSAEVEGKMSVSDSSQGMVSEGDARSGDAAVTTGGGGDTEMVEDDDEGIFNTDTAGDSEEAFNSVSVDYKSMLPDSASDVDADTNSESEGDFLNDDDDWYNNDDDEDDSDNYSSSLSDTDDDMLYVDDDLSAYEENEKNADEGDKETADAKDEAEAVNVEKSDSDAIDLADV